MKSYLAIDPGVCTGWAIVQGGLIHACGIHAPPMQRFAHVLLEKPCVYPGTPSKEANDLITLAIGLGKYVERYEALGCPITLTLPAEWKKQVPKKIHHARTLAQLSPGERNIAGKAAVKMAESKLHNMLDAVALGTWGVKKGIFK